MSESAAGGVRCPGCGKVYRWREEFAGRKVRCKQCGGVLVMPAEPPGAAGAEATQQPVAAALASPSDRCPSCGSPINPGAVICVACGFNMKEGKQIKTDVGSDEAAPKKRLFGGKKAKTEQPDAGNVGSQGPGSPGGRQQQETHSTPDRKRRHGCLTAYLIVVIVVNSGLGVVYCTF